jgi:REP element-mobilizing transposase RayT
MAKEPHDSKHCRTMPPGGNSLDRVRPPTTMESNDGSYPTDLSGGVDHSQDARAREKLSPDGDFDFQHTEITKRHGAYLPHWSAEGATYAVTFRLADSLPRVVLESFLRERNELVARARSAGRELTSQELDRLRELHAAKVEALLDTGNGSCVLRDERIAAIVKRSLKHFDGLRYDILAWCIMPNHVHVVVRPRPGEELSRILHSWKSFTSNQINAVLGVRGKLWQAEYFDHLIRDADDFERTVRYVLENPQSAGLSQWPWSGTSF